MSRKKYYPHNKWFKQLDDAYAGKMLICPYCNQKAAQIMFCFFEDDLGYAYAECKSCGKVESVISRMHFDDRIQANIVRLDSN